MSITPSGNISLSLFGIEAQPPSPLEEAIVAENFDPEGVPALVDQPTTLDNIFKPSPEPLSPPPLRTGGIRFTPVRGQVLWCDFLGYRPGEIGDKVRPVVVVSPWELNKHTVCVVPISRAAAWATALDVCLPADRYPFFTPGVDQWVMVSRITHVGHARLDRMRINGRWDTPSIAPSDLTRILTAVVSIFAHPGPSEPEAAQPLSDDDPRADRLVAHAIDQARE